MAVSRAAFLACVNTTAIFLAVVALVGLLAAWTVPSEHPPAIASIPASNESVRIELVAGDEIATATLADTSEARAFAAMLPITVEAEDPFGQAKTGRLPRAVPLDDPERSLSYAAGDLAYWSPSGTIAVVYDALGQSVPPPGLVRLGTVQTRLEAIASAGNDFTMTIRKERHARCCHARPR